MSENTTAPKQEVVIPESLIIDRPGCGTFPYVKTQVKREGNLGQGTYYLAPDKELALKDPQSIIKFFGEKKAASLIVGKLKQHAQGLFLAQLGADDFDGTFDTEQFIKDVQGLSTRGESIADLNERLSDLIDDMSELAEDEKITDEERMLKSMEMLKEMKEIKASINAKRRPREEAAPELKAA